MIRLSQIKMQIEHTEETLTLKAAKILKCNVKDIKQIFIVKKSIDARKKPEVFYTYTIDIELNGINDEKVINKINSVNVVKSVENNYVIPNQGVEILKNRPIIIGSGPSGLFTALILAENGYNPILLERGASVEERSNDVNMFWETGKLNTESNVQFGEGGAGTFSDGKLNTMVKDKYGRGYEVLRRFAEAGAKEEILYLSKPHIGTDILQEVVKNIRNKIIECGGEVRFHSKLTGIIEKDGKVKSIIINGKETIDTNILVLAIGHSARDTFNMLNKSKLTMEAKAFALGLRIQHSQDTINMSQYGEKYKDILPAADYKLTMQTDSKRGVYSFCMCPGGYVVNASSEEKRLAVNGMSYSDRAGKNANSALIVTVTPNDFDSNDVLAGIEYQRKLEELAYKTGKGKIPIQRYEDFKENRETKNLGSVLPELCGEYNLANLREMLPEYLSKTIIEGIEAFDKKISGFSNKDALLAGIESRTSSPVRINRDEQFESNIKGIYPCGEGAGYAGGITSAAIDGIKIAEAIIKKYKSF